MDKEADTDSSKPATVRTVYKKGTTETDISNFDARLKKTEEDFKVENKREG